MTVEKEACPRTRVTVADVRASFNRAKGPETFTFQWFCRPLGDLITPFFHNSGWSADGVTLFRTILAVAALLALTTGYREAVVAASVAFYVTMILDGVDGNLARLSNTASYWGKFHDGISDAVFTYFAPLGAGIGVWLFGGDGLVVAAGGVTTALTCFTQMMRNRLSFFREWMISETGPLDEGAVATLAPMQRIEVATFSVSAHVRFFAPLLLLLPDGAVYFVAFSFVAHGASDAVWLGTVIAQARVILKRGRKSVRAVAPGQGANR